MIISIMINACDTFTPLKPFVRLAHVGHACSGCTTDATSKVALNSSEKRSIIAQLFIKAVMSNSVKHFYEFGPFRIDVANRLLLRDGEPLSLTPKAVDTLLVLIQSSGQVLRKDDLMKLVWPDTVVEEGNLTQNIYLLRKTLGEGANGQNYIETVPRRGYRFVGEVRQLQPEASDLILAERTRVQVVIEEQEGETEGGRDRENERMRERGEMAVM